ncbi:MAG: hypothetical protein D6714_00590 [Bacteroidetes bacterium]|nr:MAG: hypothetical protein D6714_00590 [Bacteroidota bacterium]
MSGLFFRLAFIALFFGATLPNAGAQSATDTLPFPQSWEGKWTGELEIFSPKGKVQSLPMELHILPLSAGHWTWTLIYGEDKVAGKRDYELIEIDPAKGLYKVDEKNTIVLEGYFLGGKFFQRFEVMGSLILTSTEKTGPDTLHWEIISGNLTPVSTTGGEPFQGENIPPVNGYEIQVLQRALLKKS